MSARSDDVFAYQLKVAGAWLEPVEASEREAFDICEAMKADAGVEAVAVLQRRSDRRGFVVIHNARRRFRWLA